MSRGQAPATDGMRRPMESDGIMTTRSSPPTNESATNGTSPNTPDLEIAPSRGDANGLRAARRAVAHGRTLRGRGAPSCGRARGRRPGPAPRTGGRHGVAALPALPAGGAGGAGRPRPRPRPGRGAPTARAYPQDRQTLRWAADEHVARTLAPAPRRVRTPAHPLGLRQLEPRQAAQAGTDLGRA